MNPAGLSGTERVLFLGHSASRSGAPIVLLHLLKWFRQNSPLPFEIWLKEGGPLAADFAALARTTVPRVSRLETFRNNVFHRLGRNLPARFASTAKVAALARRQKAGLIYANTVAVAPEVRALAGLNIPIVWHIHELPFAIRRFAGGQPFREASRFTTAFIAASESVRQGLLKDFSIPEAKITVVHEFIPWAETSPAAILQQRQAMRQELGLASDAFVAGMCGTVEWRKGADWFVTAARHCATERRAGKIHFLWIGAPDHELTAAQIDHDLQRAGLTQTVKFAGGKADSQRYLAGMDLFVLPSREDPFPLAMLEAGTLGLPIVCFSGSGGGPEFVEGDAGLVVDYGDTLALARAILHLSEQPALCRQFGEAARQKVRDRFTVAKQAARVAQVIQAAMPKP